MSKSPSPMETPVQRSPSNGVPEVLQSPQHSTPGSGPQFKKHISSLLQSPSFKEELDALIQEQMKKGGSSSNLWALRQLADYMALHGSPATLPVSPSNMMMVTPINDLQGCDPGSMVKGERLMRCKIASVHRLFDLYGWAQISHTCLTLRLSKEQEHFLVLPDGLTYSEVTGSSLVKVNILGEMVEKGSTNLGVDTEKFTLHSAIYSARPDARCLLHLHTPATAAVSAMKCGLLPLSHEALLVGDVAYFEYNGVMEAKEDRVELQKSLGPTCKVLVLRNHGIVTLGESVEEAFYAIYHIQAASQIQVSALCSAGGEQNLILLDRTTYKPNHAGTVGWAGSTFGPMQKSRIGEHEFEALMRTLDNLGYRTGYAYRFPLLLERSRSQTRKDIEVPATTTAFHQFDDDGVPLGLKQHPFTQRQQQERTRWLNTPNTYQKVNQEQASPGHMRTTIRQQNQQDMKTAGPQSQVLASVVTDDTPPSPVSAPQVPPEPETPNPFNQLTDQELEDYRMEVQKKQDIKTNEEEVANDTSPATSPAKGPVPNHPTVSEDTKTDSPVIQNGGEEEKQAEELEKGMKALSTNDTSSPAALPAKPQGGTPEGSPSKSPSKKKKKFKPPSFLKKSKKQKEKAET
ncbi:beta-adducin isoform X3 [Phyllopteryx taeniolatus]|uniref:beta-adducin isoform X3 n=1 Tax=Phyllopteryx taeniolatus TaxID=161469 RepID=UPI002AD1E68F|nr:beta-adducin isoform X3 [Phyllopteryx taeniolatus]